MQAYPDDVGVALVTTPLYCIYLFTYLFWPSSMSLRVSGRPRQEPVAQPTRRCGRKGQRWHCSRAPGAGDARCRGVCMACVSAPSPQVILSHFIFGELFNFAKGINFLSGATGTWAVFTPSLVARQALSIARQLVGVGEPAALPWSPGHDCCA